MAADVALSSLSLFSEAVFASRETDTFVFFLLTLSLHPLMAWMLIWDYSPFQKVLVLKAQSKISSYVKPLMRPMTITDGGFVLIKAFLFSRGQGQI